MKRQKKEFLKKSFLYQIYKLGEDKKIVKKTRFSKRFGLLFISAIEILCIAFGILSLTVLDIPLMLTFLFFALMIDGVGVYSLDRL